MSGLDTGEPQAVADTGGEGTKAPETPVVPMPEWVSRREAARRALVELDIEGQVALSEINTDAVALFAKIGALPINPDMSSVGKPYEDTVYVDRDRGVPATVTDYRDVREASFVGAKGERAEASTVEQSRHSEAVDPKDAEDLRQPRIARRSLSISDPTHPGFRVWFTDLKGFPKDWNMPMEFAVEGPNGFVTVTRDSNRKISLDRNQTDIPMPELSEPLDIARRIINFAEEAALEPAEAAAPAATAQPTVSEPVPQPTPPIAPVA